MTPTLAPPLASIVELRVWLTAAEEMLDRQMDPDDPRHAPGMAEAERRHAEYMARVLAEGEPE